MDFQYDSEHCLGWGYYKCPSCNSTFSDFKQPLHMNGCDSSNFIYFFGPREAKRVLLFGNSMFSDLKKEHLEVLLNEEQLKHLQETSDNKIFSNII